jgi:hypothetical protein
MTTNINANLLESGSDELERYALEECVKRQRLDHRTSVLVTPADRCALAGKFARLGANVLLGDDPAEQQPSEGRIVAMGLSEQIRFTPLRLAGVPDDLPGEPFDLIVVNHGLCDMGYEQARKLVRLLQFKLRIRGKLYVSVLGLHSEQGDGYPDRERPVEERYAPAAAKKYGIAGPVCLYSERNLFMLLLDAGTSVLRTLTTTYGNVKGVAVRV